MVRQRVKVSTFFVLLLMFCFRVPFVQGKFVSDALGFHWKIKVSSRLCYLAPAFLLLCTESSLVMGDTCTGVTRV